MFNKKQFAQALSFMLLAWLPFGGVPAVGVRAQQQPQTPSQTRQRRTADSPRTTQPQQPSPQDEETTFQDDSDVVRVETDLTNILFTAVDKQKRFITNLRQEDIRVLEDGQPQEIFTFSRQTDLPLSLAIVIDTSASEERTLPIEKAAAASFVDAVLRPEKA